MPKSKKKVPGMPNASMPPKTMPMKPPASMPMKPGAGMPQAGTAKKSPRKKK